MKFNNQNLNLLLVENDPKLEQKIIRQLVGIGIENISTAKNGVAARKNIVKKKIHLAILDAELGGAKLGGIALGREFNMKYKIPILFLSKIDGWKSKREANDVPAVECLLKSASAQEMQISIQRLLMRHLLEVVKPQPITLPNTPFFLVKTAKSHLQRVDKAGLLYLEASNGGTIFHTIEKKHFVYMSLQAAITQLASIHLIRIHNKFAIHLQAIQTTSEELIGLNNGKQLPIGRLFRSNVRSLIDALRIH